METFLTLREALYGTISGAVSAIIVWLAGRRKANAEAVHIHAQSVKVSAEAQQVSTQTIIEAQNYVRELLEINGTLRNELVEANRRLDNVDFDLKQTRYEMAQMESEAKLREYLIEQLEAANNLGVKLSDLPPKPKLNTENLPSKPESC